MSDKVRNIIQTAGVLNVNMSEISDNHSLYDLGLDSFGTVDLMLAIEAAFGIQFSPQFMRRETFASIAALDAAIAAMRHQSAET